MSQEVAGPAPCQRKHSTSVNVLASLPNCGRDGLKYEYSYGRSRTKQLRKCRQGLFDQDDPLPPATPMMRGDHSALARGARATSGRASHHPRGLCRWSGYSATSIVDKPRTSPLSLAPRRGVYGSWAESSSRRRTDVANARNRCYDAWTWCLHRVASPLCLHGLRLSSRRCICTPRCMGPLKWPTARVTLGADENMISPRLARG